MPPGRGAWKAGGCLTVSPAVHMCEAGTAFLLISCSYTYTSSTTPLRPALPTHPHSNIMAGGGSAAAMQQQQELALGPPLGLVLKPELVVPLLQAPDILERLAPLLPEQQR